MSPSPPRCWPWCCSACCRDCSGEHSHVPGLATIPKTAPFAEEEIDLLNRVVGPANAVQRAWLAGFLAGVESVTGQAQPAAPARPAEPITIVYASESGNCEKLANDLAKAARKNGLKPTLIDMADLDLADARQGASGWSCIAATWGEGEPPARAVRAYNELMGEGAPRLDGVEFGVLALGDTAYAEFCAIGKKIDERLAALGGKRVVDRVDCDLDFAEPAATWIGDALKVLAPAGRRPRPGDRGRFRRKPAAAPNTEIVEAEITEHINLNSSRSDKETIHLALAFDGAAPAYEPGDSLDLYAENDPAYVDELLKLAGLAGRRRVARRAHQDRATSPRCRSRRVETYAASTGHQYVKALIDDGRGEGLDRRPPAHRSDRAFPDRAHRRAAARADAAAGAARLFDRVVAPRSRRRGASADLRGALRNPRPRPQGRRLELRRRAAQEGQPRAGQAQAQQAFRAAGARPGHHHGRPRHRRRAVPRLRAGAPRHRRQAAAAGCSSATASSPTISSTSSNGRTRSRTARSPAWTSPSRATRRRRSTCSTGCGSSAAT